MQKRNNKKYPFHQENLSRLLHWAMGKEYFSFVNGNQHLTTYGAFPNILFVGKVSEVKSTEQSFEKLQTFSQKNQDWLYGYFSYDLKNEIEDLSSNRPASIPFDHLHFIVPESIVFIHSNEITISSIDNPDNVFDEINLINIPKTPAQSLISKMVSRTSKRKYFERVAKIKDSIVNGDYYEMNYCIEYQGTAEGFDALHCYECLNELSPMPFSCFMKLGHKYLICASPERFLKKEGDKIISQPIKGTIKRSFDKVEDETLKNILLHSEKERAENLMIVDLVRNDLAKSAISGTIKVDELFGIYTFKKIHQMISTVSATIRPKTPLTEIIKNAFPMGSMTGAPKVRVMQEIEALEDSARSLYSGAVGFFTPDQDFDFNVVIRSIIFDSKTDKISFHVGSAITYDSDPEHEYNECLLKAESLFEVLSR